MSASGGGWFCAEISIVRGEISEILGDGFHRIERIVKPLQGAGERAVGNRENFARIYHDLLALLNVSVVNN